MSSTRKKIAVFLSGLDEEYQNQITLPMALMYCILLPSAAS